MSCSMGKSMQWRPSARRTRSPNSQFMQSLLEGVRLAGLPYIVYPDGMTVRISKDTAHEPDALVRCGPKLAADAVEVPDPVIVVEVLSPSTRRIDAVRKLAGDFSLSSVHHYVIADPERLPVIHHQRQQDGTIFDSPFVRGRPSL